MRRPRYPADLSAGADVLLPTSQLSTNQHRSSDRIYKTTDASRVLRCPATPRRMQWLLITFNPHSAHKPAIPRLAAHPKATNTDVLTRTLYTEVSSSFSRDGQNPETTQLFFHRRMDKPTAAHSYNGIGLSTEEPTSDASDGVAASQAHNTEPEQPDSEGCTRPESMETTPHTGVTPRMGLTVSRPGAALGRRSDDKGARRSFRGDGLLSHLNGTGA